MYAQVTIGRGIPASSSLTHGSWERYGYSDTDTVPMPRATWERFVEEAGALVQHATRAASFKTHKGTGEWHGVEEESAIVSAYSDDASPWKWEDFRSAVGVLASAYDQQAIFAVYDAPAGFASGGNVSHVEMVHNPF